MSVIAAPVEVRHVCRSGDCLDNHAPACVMRCEAHGARVRGPGVRLGLGREAVHRDVRVSLLAAEGATALSRVG
eukprot:9962059-Alexandrium_andersonii.AAC.1